MSSHVPLFRHFHPYPRLLPPIISLMMVFSRNKQFSNIPTSLGTASCHSFSRKIHQDWFHCFPIFRQSVTKYLWQNEFSSQRSLTLMQKPWYAKNEFYVAWCDISPPPTIKVVWWYYRIMHFFHTESLILGSENIWNVTLQLCFCYDFLNIDCGGGGWTWYATERLFLTF